MVNTTGIGVSFVVPVRNGASLIRETIDSIRSQADGRPIEIIVVDDGSFDGSVAVVEELARAHPIHLLRRHGSGAAAAINAGIKAARYPIICQVDQDVRLENGWMHVLTAALDDPAVAAAQGYFATDPRASLPARVMGLDLEQRYAAIDGDTDHVCTGNAAYRAEALDRGGLFDESLGYGYDNDMSYRLREAGYTLRLCPGARSFHRWRDGIGGYLQQQYGFGYGRIDLVAKHPDRFAGDRVSPAAMMIHPIVMFAALVTLAFGLPAIGLALIGALALERLVAGRQAARRFGDRAAWLFPVFHLLRDLAWVAAIGVWLLRRLAGRAPAPSDSMRPRTAALTSHQPSATSHQLVTSHQPPATNRISYTRVIGLIPAHNEAANLEAVVADIAARRPTLEVLVIDDGSSDGTDTVLEQLGVRSIRFPERMGIGSAMRAGLRYAVRLKFDVAVRLDGDGQHGAADIDALLAPILTGEADVVLGTRYGGVSREPRGAIRLVGPPLAKCLTTMTGRRVTDPTSGFCAFSRRAVRLLADHHPDGYAEPELRLFLSRNSLRVVEVPVQAHARLSGTTSLTPARVALAAARLVLAMLIVPLRAVVAEPARD